MKNVTQIRAITFWQLNDGGNMEDISHLESPPAIERLAYSIQESADMLGVNYFSIYRLIQRGKLKACRALRGKLLVPRTELLKLLATESD
jgi:excisionase family DNA binding protein